MPLTLAGAQVPEQLCGQALLHHVTANSGVRERCEAFRGTPALKLDEVTPHQQVSVQQREYATLCSRFIPEECGRRSVVSTAATTCNILALVSTAEGHCAVTLAHHDGSGSLADDGLVEKWLECNRRALDASETAASSGGNSLTHALFVVGGFLDEDGSSAEVARGVLDAFHGCKTALVELEVAQLVALNNVSLPASSRRPALFHHRDDGNRPDATNLAVVLEHGGGYKVGRVEMPVRCMSAPAGLVRSSRVFSREGMASFYRTREDEFYIAPFPIEMVSRCGYTSQAV